MNKNKLQQLLKELQKASNDCWASKIATHDIAVKNAPLCVKIVQELGYVPKLVNKGIEKRKCETDGRDVFDNDFWSDADMIIALSERLEEEFGSLEEIQNAST
jgi:hypothetical protein